MSAALRNLVGLRSLLAEEVLGYLDAVAADAAALPAYYPSHLREGAAGETPFDRIRQVVQVIDEDQREELQRLRAEERERQRAAGIEDRMAYDPVRARPELAEHEEEPEGAERREAVHREPPPPIEWDAHTGARFPRAVLLGDPGGGKTWLLRYEARRIARESATRLRAGEATVETLPMPFLFRLSDLVASGAEIEQAIPQRVLAVLKPTLARLERAVPSAGFLRLVAQSLVRGTAVVLLDAWDEVPAGSLSRPDADNPREALGPSLARFVQAHPRLRLLVSSRIVGYPGKPAPDWHELELLAFDTPQIERFTHVWFGPRGPAFTNLLDLLRRQVQLAGLARIPLMLALICRVFDESGDKDFPTQRVELYERCLLGLLLHWGKERSGRAVVSRRQPGEEGYAEALLEVLQASAFELFETQHEQFTEALLTRSLNRSLGQLELHHPLRGRSAPELIAELATRGVLTESGSGHYLFLHRTVQEYLVARHVAACVEEVGGSGDQRWDRARVRLPDGTEVSVHAWADERAIRPAYSQPMQLLAGRLAEPLPLLQLLADEERDDILRHRLALAGTCIGEIDPTIRARYASMNPNPLSVIASAGFDFWAGHEEKDQKPMVRNFLPPLRVFAATGMRLRRSARGSRWRAEDEALSDVLARMLMADEAFRAATVIGELGAAVVSDSILSALTLWLADGRRVQEWAADAVCALGAAAAIEPFLTTLVPLLAHDNWRVRASVARAVGGLSAAVTAPILSGLERMLSDEESAVRKASADAVGRLGLAAATESMLTALVRLLADEEPPWSNYVRGAAALALAELGVAAAAEVLQNILVRLLADGNGRVRLAAARAAEVVGEAAFAASVLSSLGRLLEDKEDDVREASTVAIGRLGKLAVTEPTLRTLVSLLSDESWRVRMAAASAVGRLSVTAATAPSLRALMGLLREQNSFIKTEAIRAMGAVQTGATAAQVWSAIAPSLVADTDSFTRETAADTFGALGPAAATEPILSALVHLLADKESAVRRASANAVGRLGAAAATEPILSAIVRLLADKEEGARIAAANAVGRLGPAAATEPILSALVPLLAPDGDWNDVYLHTAVVNAVGGLGAAAAAEPILSALLRLLTNKYWPGGVRDGYWGFRSHGSGPILSALPRLLTNEYGPTRWAVGDTLVVRGSLLSSFARCLKDTSSVNVEPIRAVGNLGVLATTEPILSAFVPLLADESRLVRMAAAQAVGELGAAAAIEPILGAVVRLLEDPDSEVRSTAAEALAHMSAHGVRVFRTKQGGLKSRMV